VECSGFVDTHLVERLLEAGANLSTAVSTEATLGRFLSAVRGRITPGEGDVADAVHARRGDHDIGHGLLRDLCAPARSDTRFRGRQDQIAADAGSRFRPHDDATR